MNMADAQTGACVHHWILSVPDDDVIRGRCKRCGATREYPASVEGASREGVYGEAAALSKTVSLLPDAGQERLPRSKRMW
jgi:hypothetical protein